MEEEARDARALSRILCRDSRVLSTYKVFESDDSSDKAESEFFYRLSDERRRRLFEGVMNGGAVFASADRTRTKIWGRIL